MFFSFLFSVCLGIFPCAESLHLKSPIQIKGIFSIFREKPGLAHLRVHFHVCLPQTLVQRPREPAKRAKILGLARLPKGENSVFTAIDACLPSSFVAVASVRGYSVALLPSVIETRAHGCFSVGPFVGSPPRE